MSKILGSNQSLADGYKGVASFWGYFLQTFENGIGNIS